MKLFNQVQFNRPKRSMFDLSHERKFSMNMGELIPILCEEVVPGDKFMDTSEFLLRMAPMLSPVMHRVNCYTHFFFVPSRLVWDEFKDFITGGPAGTSAPVMPYFNLSGALKADLLANGTLADYMNIATGAVNNADVYSLNALPFRAYQLIYNEYYLDQNLQTPVNISKSSGLDSSSTANMTLRTRCWEKDYFTSALPWTQRGGNVSVPMGDVYLKAGLSALSNYPELKDGNYTAIPSGATVQGAAGGQIGSTASSSLRFDPKGSLGVNAGTVNDLRRATRIQQWLEKNATGGSRYIEQILAHFGVRSKDARLQRPEFLGGGKSPVTISEVLQTSSTDATTPQANMAGHGQSVAGGHSFKKFFEEHGYVIGIMSVLPRTAYQQGTRRMYQKFDKLDFLWPEFAQLGEQPVFIDEIYSTFNNTTKTGLFGYQSRYSEYKFIPSTVHGDFKSSLAYWHMGRIFSAAPALNSAFVSSDPTHRIFAVTTPTVPKLYVQVYHNLKAIRPLPYFNVPQL
nr:MAG: major capsid protein [Microvirus sp.]